ncbi:MAG: hypothetical protein FWB82_00735 [Treponema sp.]|nr:hypothetical protein [Treponema sp.]
MRIAARAVFSAAGLKVIGDVYHHSAAPSISCITTIIFSPPPPSAVRLTPPSLFSLVFPPDITYNGGTNRASASLYAQA